MLQSMQRDIVLGMYMKLRLTLITVSCEVQLLPYFTCKAAKVKQKAPSCSPESGLYILMPHRQLNRNFSTIHYLLVDTVYAMKSKASKFQLSDILIFTLYSIVLRYVFQI